MKFTILGFKQGELIHLGLDTIDALILRYFVDFKDSGIMVRENIEGEFYYWLKYEGIMEALPILNLKKDSIYRRLKNMAEMEVLHHKTIKEGGVYSYYTIGNKYINLISDYNTNPSDSNPEPYGKESVSHTDLNPEQKINPLKNNNSIKDSNIYSLVVDYLNEKAGTRYRASSNKTQQFIRGRLQEDFTLEDFYRVIDIKSKEWLGTDMEKYLRPETLFGAKFEGYLNQKNGGNLSESGGGGFEEVQGKALDLKFSEEIERCKVCGEPVGILVNMVFGSRVYPRACRCRRESFRRQRIEEENREKQIRLQRVISNSLMNDSFRECTLENWDHSLGNEKLYGIAKEYVDKFPKMKRENQGILIYGEAGNGKTYFSFCIANALLNKLIPVMSVGAIGLVERISQSKRTWGEEGIFTVLNSLENADLLIIDDLGTEEDNRWTRAMMYQIIEKRNSTGLPIIITTNISINELKERYNDRTYSRLVSMCSFIRNTGRDIRKIQGKEKTERFLGDMVR
ncbi:conserved phage C-terminal domain-containing protein [Clostridium cochlearium]|uniref:conserved phage C-terminal domain-containing protein n=1 Tax=Clostridium cochlearium TaxID=1494 RepID=UPI001FA8F6B3|nr:conserved phage C-terminal domain-containing protein [Clostridium cochlearium]